MTFALVTLIIGIALMFGFVLAKVENSRIDDRNKYKPRSSLFQKMEANLTERGGYGIYLEGTNGFTLSSELHDQFTSGDTLSFIVSNTANTDSQRAATLPGHVNKIKIKIDLKMLQYARFKIRTPGLYCIQPCLELKNLDGGLFDVADELKREEIRVHDEIQNAAQHINYFVGESVMLAGIFLGLGIIGIPFVIASASIIIQEMLK